MTSLPSNLIRIACLALMAVGIAACGILPKKQPLAL